MTENLWPFASLEQAITKEINRKQDKFAELLIHVSPKHTLAQGNCLCQHCGKRQPIGAVIPCIKCKKPLLYSCAWNRSFQFFYDSFKDFRIEALTRLLQTDTLPGFDSAEFTGDELYSRKQALKKRISEEKYWAKRRANG